MKLLPLVAPGTQTDRITIESPDGHYVEVRPNWGPHIYKRGQFIYNSSGSNFWDLLYPVISSREFGYHVVYEGPED